MCMCMCIHGVSELDNCENSMVYSLRQTEANSKEHEQENKDSPKDHWHACVEFDMTKTYCLLLACTA